MSFNRRLFFVLGKNVQLVLFMMILLVPGHCVSKIVIPLESNLTSKMETSCESKRPSFWDDLTIGLQINRADDVFVAKFIIKLDGHLMTTISIYNPLHRSIHYYDFLAGDRYSLWFTGIANSRIEMSWKDEETIKCEAKEGVPVGRETIILYLPAKQMKGVLEQLAAEFD